MKKYLLTAQEVQDLEITVTAKNEDEAWKKLEELLDSGTMPHREGGFGGSIENKNVEEIKENL